jgi:hypothetical protein
MSVQHVEILVEEPSMEEALRQLLPRILTNISFSVYTHQCKQDLLARLPERLRGYSRYLPDNWRVVIVIDRDNDDCKKLKNRLEQLASVAGLTTRSTAGNPTYQVVNRIIIEELEAWYFGDWEAVRAAYPRTLQNISHKATYRVPDAILGGTWEAFERLLKKAGYFKGGLKKIEAARAIAQSMDPDRNTSKSFQVFRDVLREMATP